MRHVDESRNYVRDRDVARRGQRHVRRTPRSVSRAPLWPINVSSETSSHFLHRNSFPHHHPILHDLPVHAAPFNPSSSAIWQLPAPLTLRRLPSHLHAPSPPSGLTTYWHGLTLCLLLILLAARRTRTAPVICWRRVWSSLGEILAASPLHSRRFASLVFCSAYSLTIDK